MLVGCPGRQSYEQLAEQVARLRVVLTERDAALVERDRLIVELSARVEQLSTRVTELQARLGKNSQNSSKPPRSDAFVKPPPRSLRRSSGRKPGKQAGGQGLGVGAATGSGRDRRPRPGGVPVLRW